MAGWLEIVIRSVIGIILLAAFARLLRRRSVGEATFLEFGLMLGLTLIVALGSIQLAFPSGLVLTALIVWGVVAWLVGALSVQSSTFRELVYGKGIPLMKDGKILEDNLKKQQITSDELMQKLRAKNAFQFADVEFAVLEGNGELNVLLKKDAQPITAKMLNQTVPSMKEPEVVIKDGKMLDEPLATRGFNRNWLQAELSKMDVALENVFLGQVDQYGQLTVDLFDDQLQVPQPTELPLLHANLKKVGADFELFALETDNAQSKKSYQWCAEQMNEVLHSLEKYLES